MKNKSGEKFTSSLGTLAALTGSAIGLGNIWKFPYVTGENGGGAFILVYIMCALLIGLPIIMTEFALGRRGGQNIYGTMRTLAPDTKWHLFFSITIIVPAVILSYYSTIAGWTLEYIRLSLFNAFDGRTSTEVVQIYKDFTSNPYAPVIWQVAFMALTGGVVLGGVKKGIERFSKFMMPVLLLILIMMCFRSLTLNEKSLDGLAFIFKPDFTKITPNSILTAMGQAFFSLSVGMGILMTYAAYIRKDESLQRTTGKVVISDTLAAILAGVAILPATFAFGVEPNSGPGLAYLTLPQVFSHMPMGQFWSVLFFILLTVAALTSTISLLEVVVAYFTQEKKMSRVKATLFCTLAITLLGSLSTLSFGPLQDVLIGDKTIYAWLDFISSNIMLPLGGILICYFAGYVMDKAELKDELSNGGKLKVRGFGIYVFLLKFIAPISIIIIMLNSLNVF